MRDTGEKGENFNFQSCYFCHKKLSFNVKFYGEFNGAIFIFLCCIFWSNNKFGNFRHGHFHSFWMIQVTFVLIDLKFGKS